MNLLTGAAREQGTTVILVTHDARVAAYADREVIVRDGTVGTLTGRSRPPGQRGDPARPAADGQRRPGGRRPAGGAGRRGRARRRPAADRGLGINAVNARTTGTPGWTRGHQRPRARRLQAGATAATSARPVVVAAPRRRVRRAGHRPGRRRRHRADLAGAAGDPPRPRAGPVLRLPGAGRAAAQRPGERARGPLSRAPGRRHRRGGLPSPDSWSSSSATPPRSCRTPRRREGDQLQHHSAQRLRQMQLRAPGRHRRQAAWTWSCRSWPWRCWSRC